jgi:DNA-binding transcriptional LysR family regulator
MFHDLALLPRDSHSMSLTESGHRLLADARALHMIQQGCDAGIIVGGITDVGVLARPVGKPARYPAAAPQLLRSRKQLRALQLMEWHTGNGALPKFSSQQNCVQ